MRLGQRLIVAEPEMRSGELEHGEEVCGVLLVSGGEPSEVFALLKKFDADARREHRLR